MYNDYQSLTDDELDEKMEALMKKINIAYRLGQEQVVLQLQHHLQMMQFELGERLDRMRFDQINERTPESFIIGEDHDPDPSTT